MALGYRVAILSVWWQRGEVDTRFFSSKASQKTYFDNLGLTWSSLNNFNINDNITTTIVFRDSSNRDINTLLKCNYAIVKDSSSNYRYYFISNIMQDSANQLVATLELDDIQNNLIGNLSNFTPVFVKNWTGNNYKYDSLNSKYYYNFSDITLQDTGDSPQLFNKETSEAFLKYTGIDEVDTWLNNNIECWRYVFVNNNNKLGAPTLSNTNALGPIISECLTSPSGATSKAISLPYGSISGPIYKKASTHNIYIKYEYNGVDYYMRLYESGIQAFFNLQDSNFVNYPIGTYGIEEKFSNILPFGKSNSFATNYTIDNDGDLIINAFIPVGFDYCTRSGWEKYYLANLGATLSTTKANANSCVASGYSQLDNDIEATATFTASFDFVDPINENIKLLDINYSKLRLRIANQFYDYNPLAYFTSNNKNINMLYSETLKVGVSKIYFRLKSSGEYKTANEDDYTGLITNLDLTEALLTNQWADYLASHKNYYLQTAFNVATNLATNGLSPSKGSPLLKGVNTGIQTFSQAYNLQLDRENMQQSPNGLANANGDPYFDLMIKGIKPVIDYLSVNDNSKKAIISNFKYQGLPYNRVYTLSYVLNCHSAYTYLSCVINKAGANLSNKEFSRLKEKLQNGVRYWYNDNPNVSTINYYKN